jgi:hypothetical protein
MAKTQNNFQQQNNDLPQFDSLTPHGSNKNNSNLFLKRKTLVIPEEYDQSSDSSVSHKDVPEVELPVLDINGM